mmetsp:Transcript_157879/g.483795  ORF Transcript_157879/g.483795 Transcript_157879/m.483795 type:complete len:216 (-) Transcript_157879:230-877(-)
MASSHAPRRFCSISGTPTPLFTAAKTVGPSPRMARASRRMTSRSAPTAAARSTLLITSRSDCVMPGPPFRGTLSPPATSMTYTVKSASSREKLAARLSPPLSQISSWIPECSAERLSNANRFPVMSSRMAACGQPPVSTARILSGASALFRVKNSASSRVKISLVTMPREYLSRRAWQSLRVKAVFPEPTGPPMPTVNARDLQLRVDHSGLARSA